MCEAYQSETFGCDSYQIVSAHRSGNVLLVTIRIRTMITFYILTVTLKQCSGIVLKVEYYTKSLMAWVILRYVTLLI